MRLHRGIHFQSDVGGRTHAKGNSALREKRDHCIVLDCSHPMVDTIRPVFSIASRTPSGRSTRPRGPSALGPRRGPSIHVARLSRQCITSGMFAVRIDEARRHRSTSVFFDPHCPLYVDFVEEPPVLAPALGICGAVSEANSWLFASCGEDGRRERNELRQFSQILGGGG